MQQHLDRNEANKLTSQQKEVKMRKKHERDLEKESVMLVFKIGQITPQQKFKIDMNAQQLHLNGVCLVPDPHTCSGVPHILVAEGGHTAAKRYKKLLMGRI